ncbi:hypothetical protein Tcan_03991 [Toxocara canis]|uniref:THAP-type domain-containing protein n=1 Tax=Toxocara canis TaxID=6265 RepID=A0A0B2VMT1_TOXCA|nr:hypothetical protein Tcan_03991 [Toxocara canis]
MDMEIDTEYAAAAVSQLFARKKRENPHDTSLSRRREVDCEGGNDDDRESNKPSTSKWRNGIRCIAKGCSNRARDLTAWREELCKHGVQRATCECRSEQPFRLHHLNRASHQLTMLYAALLLPKATYKRIADNGCLPSYHWRVCSDHFHESQLGNQRAFPILGIGKTHKEIREIVRELNMEGELPPNFDEISLEPKRLVPCFSFPRAPGQRRLIGGNRKRSSDARSSRETERKGKGYEEEDVEDRTSEKDQPSAYGSEEDINNAESSPGFIEADPKSVTSKGETRKRRYHSTSPVSVDAKERKKGKRARRLPAPMGVACAVMRCVARAGDEIDECGIRRPVRFFSLPSSAEGAARWIFACKRDRSTRQYWMKRIRCMMLRRGKRPFRAQNDFVVCESHFVDGRPTSLNPNPTLCIPSLSIENPETEKPKCIIAGCDVCGGMRNPKSKENAEYELYLLPSTNFEQFKWLTAIRRGKPNFPKPSSRSRIYVCERHFSTKKFDYPVKHLTSADESSDTETSDSDSAEESNLNEANLSEEQKEKYRSLMSMVLQRRPMFKCLVRCCPVTNHIVKNDRLRPYVFFDLPRIPNIRGRWLDALYISDPAFEFPPPLIGCGKYAVCERHFATGKIRANSGPFSRLPLSIIPSVNLTPHDARNVDVDTKVPEKSLFMKSIVRCVGNHPDQQLQREMKALFRRWCCREVPEIHKIIVRLSSKIDRLYELIVQLCGVYGVEPTLPPAFDAMEDDRVYGKSSVGSLLANDTDTVALEKALEGLMAITKAEHNDVTPSVQPKESDSVVDIAEKQNERQGTKQEASLLGDESMTNNDGHLKPCDSNSQPSSPGSGCLARRAAESPKQQIDQQSEDNTKSRASTEEGKVSQLASAHLSEEGEGECALRVASSESGESVCDDLGSEHHAAVEMREASNGESADGIGADEVAPPLSPHVEDGPPLLFTEVIGFGSSEEEGPRSKENPWGNSGD